MAEAFRDFDVEVILVLRRQDELAHSLYLENIMKGSRRGRMSFSDFRKFIESRHLRFEDNIATFERVFGPVRVLTYEGLARDNRLLQNFFAELGFRVAGLEDSGLVRQSLTVRQARMKRAFLPLIGSHGQNRQVNRFLRWGPMARASARFVDEPETGFWENESARQRWLECYAEENERIRSRFFPDRASLFSPGLDC
ncbi:hypothetical protein [Thiohalorhabdus sp.]|uniref:hypothetical protein n=1 Tax=Thiohalorhabdus sp. TaxID=3094134 RepID=UPI002FC27FA1